MTGFVLICLTLLFVLIVVIIDALFLDEDDFDHDEFKD